jgi:conserved hypothetical phage tail region protein
MEIGQTIDPYLAFNFKVEIDGLQVGGFNEVTGLQVEVEVNDYREGGVNDYIHKLSGPVRYPNNLTLKKGFMDRNDLRSWFDEVMVGWVERKNISIILCNSAGEEVCRWSFREAYPVKWSGPELRAGTDAVAIETLELAHHGLIGWL